MTRLNNYLSEETNITDEYKFLEYLHEIISPRFLDECKKAKGFIYRGSERNIKDYDITIRDNRSRNSYMNIKLYNWFNDALNEKFGWKVRDGIFTTGDLDHTDQFGFSYLFFPLNNNYKFVWHPYIKDLNYDSTVEDLDDDSTLRNIDENIERNLPELKLIVSEYKDKDLDDAIKSGHEIIFDCKKFLYVNKRWENLCKGLI